MEKRNVPRVNAGVPVELYQEDGSRLLALGHMNDVGENGAGLSAKIDFLEGQTFFMRFLIGKRYMIKVWPKVVRVIKRDNERFYGVKFNKIGLLHHLSLKQYIDKELGKVGV